MDVRQLAVDSGSGIVAGQPPPWGYPGSVGRLAILAPFGAPSVRGNSVTVERVTRGLRECGADLQAWDTSAAGEAAIVRDVVRGEGDVRTDLLGYARHIAGER